MPIANDKHQEKAEARKQYTDLLTFADGTVIPDPYILDKSVWISEQDGVMLWPPCMVISDYLTSRDERPALCAKVNKRLQGNYVAADQYLVFVVTD